MANIYELTSTRDSLTDVFWEGISTSVSDNYSAAITTICDDYNGIFSQITSDDGLTSTIQIRFPDDVDLETVSAAFTAALNETTADRETIDAAKSSGKIQLTFTE
jgi:nitric oxide reductase large subunit